VNTSSKYRLRDKTHSREIETYDAANSESFNTGDERGDGISNGTLPLSEDIDGDKKATLDMNRWRSIILIHEKWRIRRDLI
jgi:hypothetical protein